MAKVVYEHVTKRFREVVAVNDLSLEIEDREFLVLVGPSGCGKSTVIRLLAGLEKLTDGNIYIADHLVNDVPVRDRDIAMVFQSYALYPHMTVFENMAFGLRMHGTPRNDVNRRVLGAAEALGIEELLKRKPAQLSGGQRQRVALGRAIVREPQVFLFDEPLSNLDAKLRVQTRTELSKLHERLGTTFIYVTHDQVEAMTMATRIAVLKDGLLQQVGTPEQLYFQPDNLFVAGFIGSPAMNFVPTTLRGNAETMTLDADTFQITLPPDRSKRLFPQAGQEVLMGIRPEDIHSPGLLPPHVKTHPVSALVDVTEMLGNETLLHLIVDGHSILARVDPRTRARAGQQVEVQLDIDRLHIFDAKTQLAIDKIELPNEKEPAASPIVRSR
ncbi:MAG TPA: sn-glycerol-3-phosphate ABC transporter ATP-binding protein UgpC [Thermoleophilia bacterium]|nr:sn-glycerol-3-phosphate ABC transporter ATP-binding protein UgpC [Thermoleophilia bacterium]